MKIFYTTVLFLLISITWSWGQGRLHRLQSEAIPNWSILVNYDSLDQAVYSGNIYKLTTATSVGERPDLFPENWTKITTDNPVSGAVVDSLRTFGIKNLYLTDSSVGSFLLNGILDTFKTVNLFLTLTDTATYDRIVYIPSQSSILGNAINISNSNASTSSHYVLKSIESPFVISNTGRYTDTYLMGPDQSVSLINESNTWYITTTSFSSSIRSIDQINSTTFLGDDIITIGDSRFNTLKTIPRGLDANSRILQPVKDAAPYGENLLYRSEQMTSNLSVSCPLEGWALSSPMRDNIVDSTILDPFGKNYVRVFKPLSGTNGIFTKYIDFCGSQDIQFALGDTVTFSFYFRSMYPIHNLSITSVNVIEREVGGAATVNTLSTAQTVSAAQITNQWKRYVFTFVIGTSSSGSPWTPGARFTVNYTANQDEFAVLGGQLERTQKASIYKPTYEPLYGRANFSDTTYLIPVIENRALDLSKYVLDEGYVDSEMIQDAFAFCELTGLCSSVKIGIGTIIDTTIVIPSGGYILEGVENSKLANLITVDLQDSTMNAIELEQDGAYASEQTIRNLNFDIVSDAYNLIYTGSSNKFTWRDCNVTGSSIFKRVITIGDPLGLGAIGTIIDNVSSRGGRDYGVYLDGAGNNHEFISCNFRSTHIGVYINSASLVDIRQGSYEDIPEDGFTLYVNQAATVRVDGVYFEDAPLSINNTDKFLYNFSRSFDLIHINNVVSATISNSKIYGDGYPIKPIGDPSKIKIIDNWFNVYADLLRLKNMYRDDYRVIIEGNNTETLEDDGWNEMSRIGSNESYFRNTHLENTSLGDTVFLNNTVLKGLQENLLRYSDSLMVADSDDINRKVENNVILAPDGTLTGDLVIQKTNVSGSASFGARQMAEVQLGDTITMSVWAKPLNTGQLPLLTFNARFGASGVRPFGRTEINGWKRYYVTIDSVDETTSLFTQRLSSMTAGDSIAYWGWQINRGPKPLAYTPTTSLSIESSDAVFEVIDNDNTLEIIGSVNLTDTLQAKIMKDTDGNIGTNGQELTSTGTGINWQTKTTTGNTTTTTDGSGQVTVPHGLGTTPSAELIQIKSGTWYRTIATSDATNITITFIDTTTGLAAASAAVDFSWVVFR